MALISSAVFAGSVFQVPKNLKQLRDYEQYWTSNNPKDVVGVDLAGSWVTVYIEVDKATPTGQSLDGINAICNGASIHHKADGGGIYCHTNQLVSWSDDGSSSNGAGGRYVINP